MFRYFALVCIYALTTLTLTDTSGAQTLQPAKPPLNCKKAPIKAVAISRRSETEARKRVVQLWRKWVKAKYDAKWIDWKRAAKRKISCNRTASNNSKAWRCQASALPCRIARPRFQPRIFKPTVRKKSSPQQPKVATARPKLKSPRLKSRTLKRSAPKIAAARKPPRRSSRTLQRSRTTTRSAASKPATSAKSSAPAVEEEPAALESDFSGDEGADPDVPFYRTVYYATNRKRSNSSDPEFYFSGKRSAELKYGAATVSIPRSHQRGKLESAFFGLSFLRDPKKHILVAKLDPMKRETFFNEINARRSASPDKSIVVYVHGFNVSFGDSLKRGAQIVFDFNYQGTPIAFSWPSNGSAVEYGADREAALWSVRHLERFLLALSDRFPDRELNIVAHSMGNLALLNAMRLIALQRPDDQPFDNVILAAPDFDADLFTQQIAGEVEHLASNWAVYISKQDSALTLSAKLNDAPRLGLAPLTVVDGYQIIDASEIEVSRWDIGEFHSYYATKKPVIEDMVKVLQGLAPRARGLKRYSSSSGPYWRFR